MNQSQNKIKVGILGATGTVGQKFITLLADHTWFEITCLAASSRSAGKPYSESVKDRWVQKMNIPSDIAGMNVFEVDADMKFIADQSDMVFSALSMDKAQVKIVEEQYAALDIPVVSNNSAHRWTEDVPVFMPEINPDHVRLIDIQRRNRGWTKGFITAKPNCSIQSYVPVLDAVKSFGPKQVIVSTYQAISGAGKTLEQAPEILDNVNPYIGGEEKKSEDEPMKIWGAIKDNKLKIADKPIISANCLRVPVSDGHLVAVNVSFENKPTREQFIDAIRNYPNPLSELNLPSSPENFMIYHEEDDRPQTKLDRNAGNGMSISVGRLREDNVFDWKFVALSHNTLRGAAGGAVLTAEMLVAKGYIG